MFSSRLKSDRADMLAKAFLSLETEEDCFRLFEDHRFPIDLRQPGLNFSSRRDVLCDFRT